MALQCKVALVARRRGSPLLLIWRRGEVGAWKLTTTQQVNTRDGEHAVQLS